MMRLRRHWGDDGRSGEHRVPLRRGGGSGFGRSVGDDLGHSSLHLSASSRGLLLLSSSLSSEEEMGLNVPPSSHGTTTTTKTATAATIATTIAAATERNVDRRGRLDRTTPSTTRYGGCERSALLLHHRRCPSRWRPKEGWVVVRWEDDCRVVASSSREGNLGGTRTTTTCRPTMP